MISISHLQSNPTIFLSVFIAKHLTEGLGCSNTTQSPRARGKNRRWPFATNLLHFLCGIVLVSESESEADVSPLFVVARGILRLFSVAISRAAFFFERGRLTVAGCGFWWLADVSGLCVCLAFFCDFEDREDAEVASWRRLGAGACGDWLKVTDDFSAEFLRLRFARLVGADAELTSCTNSMSSSWVKGVESNMRF